MVLSGRRNVLVATSDSSTKQLVVDRLSARGYQVTTVERGSDVLLAVIEDHAGVVIIDLAIGEPSGISTVEIIRKMRPRLPVIVLSGDDSVETGRQVLQHGPLHYLLKPVNLNELDQIVEIAFSTRKQVGNRAGSGRESGACTGR